MSCSCGGVSSTGQQGTSIYDTVALQTIKDRVDARARADNVLTENKTVINKNRIAYLLHDDTGNNGEFYAVMKGIPVRVVYRITNLEITWPRIEVEVQLQAFVEGIKDPVYEWKFSLLCENVLKADTCRVSMQINRSNTPNNPAILGCDWGCVVGCASGLCSFCFDLGEPTAIAVCVAACSFYCWWDCC